MTLEIVYVYLVVTKSEIPFILFPKILLCFPFIISEDTFMFSLYYFRRYFYVSNGVFCSKRKSPKF